MVEMTRIITARITVIGKDIESEFLSEKEVAECFLEDFKKRFIADDVVVTDVQSFVRDIEA